MPVLCAYIPKKTTQLEQVQRRAARYVTNRYHNTSIVSSIIEHLNWWSLADQRTDARLVMLYKILHELVAIPKTQYSYHQLDSPGTCILSYTKYHPHAYNTDSNLSFWEQYKTRTVSSWTLWRVTVESFKSAVSFINH